MSVRCCRESMQKVEMKENGANRVWAFSLYVHALFITNLNKAWVCYSMNILLKQQST